MDHHTIVVRMLEQLGGNATRTDSAVRGPHAPASTGAAPGTASGEEASEAPDRHTEEQGRGGGVEEHSDRQAEGQ